VRAESGVLTGALVAASHTSSTSAAAPASPSTWQFSLEEAGTEERRGFRDLEALVAYLGRELGCENGSGA
jgi:hypothetical protein